MGDTLSAMEERDKGHNENEILMKTIFTQLFADIPLLNSMMLFAKMTTNIQGNDYDKVDFYLKLLNAKNLLPDAAKLEEKKDDNISEDARKEGNLCFVSKPPKYVDALKSYNKSLCFAVSKGNQCLALTNRSAVFFKMEMYQECLESIQLAREVGLLESVREKVELRATMCQKKLKKMRQKEVFVPKIGLPVNEKIPFVAKCLELREDKQYGRCVFTDKDIPAGTIIAIKEPFCKIILNEDKYLRCTNCFVELTHLLMPCDTCTQAMFCSKECKEKAYEDFHVIECPISGSLYKIFDIHYLLAFRLTIKAFLAFPDTETMVVALEKMDREQKNVFSYDWSQELSQEDLYASFRTLLAKPHMPQAGVYVGSSLAFNLLKHSCAIFSQRYLTSSVADNQLKTLMCRNIYSVHTNSFSYGNFSTSEDPREGYGTAICGFYSLINHSCASNVAPFVTGGTQGIIAIKNIPKGMQLFTNYGVHHVDEDRVRRQDELMKRYGFHCQCLACVKDFPMMDYFPVSRNIMPSGTTIARNLRERYSFEFNKKGFKFFTDYIRKNSINYPSPQLYHAQLEIHICLQILCVVPLNIREKVLHDQ